MGKKKQIFYTFNKAQYKTRNGRKNIHDLMDKIMNLSSANTTKSLIHAQSIYTELSQTYMLSATLSTDTSESDYYIWMSDLYKRKSIECGEKIK